MKGTPKKPLYIGRSISNTASFIAALLFVLIVLYLYSYGGGKGLGLLLSLWIIYSGIVASSIYPLIKSYHSATLMLIHEYRVGMLRPPFKPPSAIAAVLAVPFIAPLVAASMNHWLLNVTERIAARTGISVEEVARELPASITSLKPFVISTAIPILQPIALLYSWRQFQLTLCGLLRILTRKGLWDKPCTPDFIEIMIWAQPNNLALDSKLLSEKWSIKD